LFSQAAKIAHLEALNHRAPRPYVEVHAEDATRLGMDLATW